MMKEQVMMRRGGWAVVGVIILSGVIVSGLAAQTDVTNADREAIVAAALDYIEGWHEANPERMARALHSDLAKRIAMPNRDGVRTLNEMGKQTLVEMTGRNRAQADVDFRDQVKILDVFGGAAVVRVDADTWVDFLQIAKFEDRWLIVNVLWELRPKEGGGR